MFAGVAADGVKDKVSFTGPAQRIRLDSTNAVVVDEINAEKVRGGEPDDLEE
jgi:hypothetical protein